MGGNIGLTEKQNAELGQLYEKDKRTHLQELKMLDLIAKRDNPELPQGAKTYCQDWLKGELFEYQKMVRTKYTDKGNIMEDESIDLIADILGYGFLMKNEDHFQDEFMTGTPDVILKSEIIDVKNSWDCSTFPFFDENIPNQDYYWQLQGYMSLCNKDKAKLIYTLLDTPEHLIEREARYYCISQGYEELEMSIYEQFEKNMTYKNTPAKYRIKVFEVDRDNKAIEEIKMRVKLCREYIEELKSKLS
jgi:hypothetical protein